MAETTTSFSSDQLNQQIELILDASGITPQNGEAELYDKITALLDTPQKKQQFFDEMVAYKTAQPNLANYQDLYDDALDFSRKQPGNYDKGTYSSIISLVNREKATGLDSSFLDVYHICNQPEASRIQELKNELDKQSHRRLLTGALEIQTPNDQQLLKKFMTALRDSEQKFDKIVIPVGCDEQGHIRHAISLIIEGNRATIVDQLGGGAYQATKTNIVNTLNDFGITTTVYAPALSQNRSDCAIFTSMVNEVALQGDLNDFLNQFQSLNQDEKWAKVDAQHAKDIKAAAQAYYKNYQNNPVFKLYLQTQSITDFNNMNVDAKDKIIECFNQVTAARDFVVDEYAPTPQDLEWKEEVNAVFMPNCQKLTRAFQRFDTKDDRELRYRLNNSLIYYYDKKHVRIRSESTKDFVLICQTAKDMGNNTITFGAFEKHPEYKAKLYLAALQTGMKMKNQPGLDELRAYPEFTQIQNIIKQKKFEEESRKAWEKQPKLRKQAKKYHAELEQANAAANQDPDYRTLKSELFNAQKALRNAQKNGADPDTLKQLGENVDEAKRKFNENPSQAAIASAETNFRNTIKEMADNYIKYGSSEKDKTKPNERKEKLKKHLEIYDANTFFTKTIRGRDNKGYPLYEETESAMELQRKMTDNEKKNLIREQTKNYKEVQTGLREYMKSAGR